MPTCSHLVYTYHTYRFPRRLRRVPRPSVYRWPRANVHSAFCAARVLRARRLARSAYVSGSSVGLVLWLVAAVCFRGFTAQFTYAHLCYVFYPFWFAVPPLQFTYHLPATHICLPLFTFYTVSLTRTRRAPAPVVVRGSYYYRFYTRICLAHSLLPVLPTYSSVTYYHCLYPFFYDVYRFPAIPRTCITAWPRYAPPAAHSGSTPTTRCRYTLLWLLPCIAARFVRLGQYRAAVPLHTHLRLPFFTCLRVVTRLLFSSWLVRGLDILPLLVACRTLYKPHTSIYI